MVCIIHAEFGEWFKLQWVDMAYTLYFIITPDGCKWISCLSKYASIYWYILLFRVKDHIRKLIQVSKYSLLEDI